MKKIILLLAPILILIFFTGTIFADGGVLWTSQDGHQIFESAATATQNLPLGGLDDVDTANAVCKQGLVYAVSASRNGCLPLIAYGFQTAGQTHFACTIPDDAQFISLNDKSCARPTEAAAVRPEINKIDPDHVQMDSSTPGFNLTISGQGFGGNEGKGGVVIEGDGINNFLTATVQSWTDRQIQVYARPRGQLVGGDSKWNISVITDNDQLVANYNLNLVITYAPDNSHVFTVNQPAANQPKTTPQIFIAGSPLSTSGDYNLFTAEDLNNVQLKLNVEGQSEPACEDSNQSTFQVTLQPSSGSSVQKDLALCEPIGFTVLNDPNVSYMITVNYHEQDYSWEFKIKKSSAATTNSSAAAIFSADNVNSLIQQIYDRCENTEGPCVDQMRKDCFGNKGLDTTLYDNQKKDVPLPDKYSSADEAKADISDCIKNHATGTSVSHNSTISSVDIKVTAPTGGSLIQTANSNSDTGTSINLWAGAGTYKIELIAHYSDGTPDQTIRKFNVEYNPNSQPAGNGQSGNSGQNGSGQSGNGQNGSGDNGNSSGSSTSGGNSSGSTQILSCTGRCAVCPSGQVEGTVKYGDGTTQGACVSLSSCPSGQQQCTDNPDSGTNAPTCNYSQSCGNGGSQVCHGKYVEGQCRYVAGYSSCEACQGEAGAPNRICTPGSYKIDCTGQCGGCSSGSGEAKVSQCNSNGTAYDVKYNQCSGQCAQYCHSTVPTGPCTYPEAIDTSICPSGVHVCHGTYDNGVCKYDPGVDPACSCS